MTRLLKADYGLFTTDGQVGHFALSEITQVETQGVVAIYSKPAKAALCGAPMEQARVDRAWTTAQELWPLVSRCTACEKAAVLQIEAGML
jgi:hypothetical protein